jgi:hypothetical protein
MAKYSKEEWTEVKKERKELLNLILDKTGFSYKKLIDLSEQEYIAANLDLVTPAERMRFKKLIFN